MHRIEDRLAKIENSVVEQSGNVAPSPGNDAKRSGTG
jgi:hypothetical protein